MKTHGRLMAVAGLSLSGALLASGCSGAGGGPQFNQQGAANEAMVHQVFNRAADNAVVAEHTLYPYHFRANEAALNDLGEQHLDTLAAAYRTAPGNLVVVRGQVASQLYEARVKAALQWLAAAGVDTAHVTTSADLPGGPGISSAQAIRALGEPEGGIQPSAGGTDSRQQSSGGTRP